MSDKKNSDAGPYYPAGSGGGSSYQQGASGAAVVAQATAMTDHALAQSLYEEEMGNTRPRENQQPPPMVTGWPLTRGGATQYVTMYPPSNDFDPTSLGVSGNFIAPHELRLMEAFSLGRVIRTLALLDGLILLINCAWFPVLFLLIVWAPLSGWMAGTRFSSGWAYAFCCYYVMRISLDLAYIILGYAWFLLMLLVNLIVARYLFRFTSILNTLSAAEIEQLRNPSAIWSDQYRQQQQFQML